jgi:hypothetical protein
VDTRQKILERIEDASDQVRANGKKLLVLSGYFDVLTPSMVARIQSIEDQHPECAILALVLDMNSALLPQRARAELAASLRAIDHVLMARSIAGATELLAPDLVVRDEENQLADRRLLINHVQRRYQE